ncbi:MAG TPA: hypothetical protein VFA46_09650 [Actinomycetes bacterium]|jgi:hypothetical protein|nr:hypothetical protein [Actinomycetes bacterium]
MSGDGQRSFGLEPPELAEIWAALDDASGVDTRRVLLAARGETVALGGSLGSPEQAGRAVAIVSRFGVPIVDRQQIDSALREGTERPPTDR